ncbi:MAG: hypothetical protein VCD66_17480, partial [Alphaproteobacteria bacterium]
WVFIIAPWYYDIHANVKDANHDQTSFGFSIENYVFGNMICPQAVINVITWPAQIRPFAKQRQSIT